MTAEEAAQASGFLGLCNRAGQLIFGQDACVNAVRKHQAALILLDEGCSENTRKRFLDACRTHETPLYGVKEDLIDRAVGKEGRKVAAVKRGSMGEKMRLLFGKQPCLYEDRSDK